MPRDVGRWRAVGLTGSSALGYQPKSNKKATDGPAGLLTPHLRTTPPAVAFPFFLELVQCLSDRPIVMMSKTFLKWDRAEIPV